MVSKRYPELNDFATLNRMYWDEMMTMKEMAKSIGCSEASVYMAMRVLDVPSRPRGAKRGDRIKYPLLWDPEWLYARYWEDGMYQREIAALLNCPVSAVIRAMRIQHTTTRPYPSSATDDGRAVFDPQKGRYVLEADR